MDSGSEDGEIAGEINEEFDKSDYVQPLHSRQTPASSSKAASLTLLQQLVPGWGNEDDEPAAEVVKKKPKKQKKHKKSKQQPASAAGGSQAAQQAAGYRSFYGHQVRTCFCCWLAFVGTSQRQTSL
jgi:hypothetical protein